MPTAAVSAVPGGKMQSASNFIIGLRGKELHSSLTSYEEIASTAAWRGIASTGETNYKALSGIASCSQGDCMSLQH
jgi:hypothetical protein